MLDYHSWPQAIRALTVNVCDFAVKETRLTKAEMAVALTSMAKGAVFFCAAAMCVACGTLVGIEAAIFAIAATGIALHWSCLIVMGGFLLVAICCAIVGRTLIVKHSIVPKRAISQFNRAINDIRSDADGK